MSERFFILPPVEGERATLTGPEAHHLAHVLRAKVGDTLVLFDGLGSEFIARVEKIGKSAVELAIQERRAIDRESAAQLTLAVALPKGDRQRWLVEKAVELGVAKLTPLVTARGVAQPVEAAVQRLRRAVVEASKQCGRNRLMEIAEPQRLEELARSTSAARLHILAHLGGRPLRDVWPTEQRGDANGKIVAAVGPEGGFTADEIAKATADGWAPVDLGPRILRVETTAITIAAWAALVDQP